MILCPNCQHNEISGALFCSECGAQLVFTEKLSTQAIFRAQSDVLLKSSATPRTDIPTIIPEVLPSTRVSLNVLDGGEIFPLTGRSDFTLGRVAEGQPILPDIDLSPFEAYSQGVSRIHAVIKTSDSSVTILDLGSSNGTRVNGLKIAPNIDYPLKNGDLVALGKLKIQMIIRQ